VQTLRNLFGIAAVVKWPNDVLVGDRKIAGMLAEMAAETDRIHFVNIGLGINVNNDPTSIEPRAVSLRQLLGRTISRKKLLAAFLDKFESRIGHYALENVIDQWKRYTDTIGRVVKIVTASDEFEGQAVDVDDSGALILQLGGGSIQKILYGDCFYQTG
jgi:BirA family biotin operon repressor/biotin-[acetyl-CoA-carboxylase] ligase